MRTGTLLSFYSKKDVVSETPNDVVHSQQPDDQEAQQESPSKIQKLENTIKHDPGLRQPIWKYPYKEQDEVRRRYVGMKACQPNLRDYPRNKEGRCFLNDWYKDHNWLEYSETNDKAYCFPCFLFEVNTSQRYKKEAWTLEGFNRWKRIGGRDSSLRLHEGGPNSLHANNVVMLEAFSRPSQDIAKQLQYQSSEEVKKNRLRVITSVKAILWLACQGCALRGNDESLDSSNRGNFIELLKYTSTLNTQIAEVVLQNAPGNAMYTSPKIQNDILKIIGDLIRISICAELGDSKFCILIDESQDESNCEQMALVLRFVDDAGFIRERFFDVVGVEDTTSLTLMATCSTILDRNGLLIENIRGQGYDGASNMRGAWSGLQALFLKECPYAYYVHCFAHRLQLALVAASGELDEIELFFQMLNCIVNLVRASPKRNQQLKNARRKQLESLMDSGDLQTSKGGNQKIVLRRPASTRWSSHYSSACSVLDLYVPTVEVLEIIKKDGLNRKIRAEASGALSAIKSFKFVFILHLMVEVMGITEVLCQALQKKTQDILSGMDCILVTTTLLSDMKHDDRWDNFLRKVVSFCTSHVVDVPDMKARFMQGTSRSCQQRDEITIEHHFRFDILNETINTQIMEIKERFSDNAVELLRLTSVLNPKDSFKALNIDDACLLAKKYYPGDFTEMEINHELRHQLMHYECDMHIDPEFQDVHTLPELCQKLARTQKSKRYHLIDRLIRLVLTLPVSTATTERAFSAMKLIKTPLRNKMGDEVLTNHMIIYIEREIANGLNPETIVNEFDFRENRRVRLNYVTERVYVAEQKKLGGLRVPDNMGYGGASIIWDSETVLNLGGCLVQYELVTFLYVIHHASLEARLLFHLYDKLNLGTKMCRISRQHPSSDSNVTTNVPRTGTMSKNVVTFDKGYQMILLPGGMYMGSPCNIANSLAESKSFHLEFCWLESPNKRQILDVQTLV